MRAAFVASSLAANSYGASSQCATVVTIRREGPCIASNMRRSASGNASCKYSKYFGSIPLKRAKILVSELVIACGREVIPEAHAIGPCGDVRANDVIGIGDPERRRLEIRRQDFIVCARGARQETDVVLERIPRFDTVFEKVTVPDRIECEDTAYHLVIRSMHGDTPIVTVDDARSFSRNAR